LRALRSLFLIAFLTIWNGCSVLGDGDEIDGFFWGEVTAQKNGVQWTANPYAVDNLEEGHINIFFAVLDSSDLITEWLALNEIPLEVGEHEQQRKTKFPETFGDIEYSNYRIITGGDEVLYSYQLVSEEKNVAEISSIRGREVTGTFRISLKVVDSSSFSGKSTSAADTVRFFAGEFHTRILTLDELREAGEN